MEQFKVGETVVRRGLFSGRCGTVVRVTEGGRDGYEKHAQSE